MFAMLLVQDDAMLTFANDLRQYITVVMTEKTNVCI